MVPATLATIINYKHNLFIAQATGRHTRAHLFGASVATKEKFCYQLVVDVANVTPVEPEEVADVRFFS
jgi:hypothetical protein